jgi:hypothetical protein
MCTVPYSWISYDLVSKFSCFYISWSLKMFRTTSSSPSWISPCLVCSIWDSTACYRDIFTFHFSLFGPSLWACYTLPQCSEPNVYISLVWGCRIVTCISTCTGTISATDQWQCVWQFWCIFCLKGGAIFSNWYIFFTPQLNKNICPLFKLVHT